MNIEKNEGVKKIGQLYSEMIKERQLFMDENYPTDIPNIKCHNAFIKGIKYENSFKPHVHDFSPLMKYGNEELFIWTHTENKSSVLISSVSLCVKEEKFWKNIGNVIQLCYSYYRDFEHTMELEYKWCYYFDSKAELEDTVIYDCSDLDRYSIHDGTELKLTEFILQSRLIELLLRDDKIYTALSTMYASMETHYCCLVCELDRFPYKKHPSHEPELWEQASMISKYEIAIVQACRCVEALIGKPTNQSNRSRLLQHKQKWKDVLGINPDDVFHKGEMTYLDFYYKLFDLRNSAAHSYGTIPFELERKQAVDSQCFASLLLDGYILKHVISEDEAILALRLNVDLIEQVDETMSTTRTY